MNRIVKGGILLGVGALLLAVVVIAQGMAWQADLHQKQGLDSACGIAGIAFLINTIWGYWCLFMADN